MFIKQQGVLPSERVRDDDLDQIVNVMILDQKLEKFGDYYKAANWQYPGHSTAYTSSPCAACTLRSECGPTNRINPQTCQYMKAWLDQF